MFDISIYKEAHCSKDDKITLLKTIEYIMSLHERICEFGLLDLETEIEKNRNTMLGKGLMMIVSGAKSSVIRKVMTNYIYSSGCRGKHLLEKIIIAEGIIFLHMHFDNSRFLIDVLISHLGEEFIEEAECRIYKNEKRIPRTRHRGNKRIHRPASKIRTHNQRPESSKNKFYDKKKTHI